MIKKKIITHNGAFHADDVCAVASLMILFGDSIEIVRTREPELIQTGDIVLDVGGKYDDEKNFDHHQEGGAGSRVNDIPYASFGLIWKRFGIEICKGKTKVAEKFDEIFVQPVDALDNGVQIVESRYNDLYPYSFNNVVLTFNPTWKEGDADRDQRFMQAVGIFKHIIERTLAGLMAEDEARELVIRDYNKAEDKRIIVLESNYPFQGVLSSFPEPLLAIYKSPQQESWHVKAIWSSNGMFNNRIYFPKEWAGKTNSELEKVTGVEDAAFCHNKLFLVTARTKEAAIKLAELAVK